MNETARIGSFGPSVSERSGSDRLGGRLRRAASAFLAALARRGVVVLAETEAELICELDAMAQLVSGAGPDPLDRLQRAWRLGDDEIDLFFAAGLGDVSPVAADLIRQVNARGEHALPISVAADLLSGASPVLRLHRLLCGHVLLRSGLLLVEGEGPLFDRTLRMADGVWPGVFSEPIWPKACEPMPVETVLAGLENWCGEGEVAASLGALRRGGPVAVVCFSDQRDVRLGRATALCGYAGLRFAVCTVKGIGDEDRLHAFLAHALLRGCCPVILLDCSSGGEPQELVIPDPSYYPAPIIIAARGGSALSLEGRTTFAPVIRPIAVNERFAMWQSLGPDLGITESRSLATRFVMEPLSAARLARDAAIRARGEERDWRLDDVTAAIRARGALIAGSGLEIRSSRAGWEDIALGREARAALRGAVARLEAGADVLPLFPDTRRPAGGLKLLFSGAPGTGKTLAAEVLAHEIGADLLVVDTAKVVSKWLGETERNLAAAFDAAAESHAVLFFDEADALFAKRTDTSDSRDRYANMETAFLLQKLERFSGIAVLATNLARNLDEAFRRRFDVVVEFADPDASERTAIWHKHLPHAGALVNGLDIDGIAAWYAVPGSWIRNAAHAATFAAAAERLPVGRKHLLQAIAKEYRKAGRAFPGMPPLPAGNDMEVENATGSFEGLLDAAQ